MKTAQIMVRDLRGLPIRQNHKTGMFNANDLIDAYNKKFPQSRKRLQNFLRSNSTEEYISFLENKDISHKLNVSDVSYLDSSQEKAEVVKTCRGRVNGGTWMHPHLFIDLSMWLNVEFKDWAMSCVMDKLIQHRNDAGDQFIRINKALDQCGAGRRMVYVNEAKMINKLVFGKADKGQRNTATEEQLDLLKKLQKADVKLVRKGLSYEQRKGSLVILKDLLT